MGTVELAESNSYLINPLKGNVQTLYSVPITRINKFWGSSDGQLDLSDNNTLSATTEWVAEVIWQDQPMRLINFCSKDGSVADGNTDYSGRGESFFYFKPIDGAFGNVVIGVRKKTGGKDEYLWSWHLWLTDYKPEYTTAWQEGVYSYVVEGGHVHRYAGNSTGTNIWDTKYLNKYIMDRNLGASSATSGRDSYGFYYQFGRKDPFPHSSTTLYDIDGNPQTTFTASNGDCIERIAGTAYFYMGVKRPYSFYYPGSNDWVRENPYSALTILWDNPTWYTSDSNKSLFDPCPPGWKLPESGTWSNFGTTFEGSDIVRPNAKEYFESGSSGFRGGWSFYMGGRGVGETSWYPAAGYRNVGSGAMYYVGSNGYCWSASPYDATYGYYLYFNSGSVNPQYTNQRGYGISVRCVQE